MGKGYKASASTATRKKHSRKAAAAADDEGDAPPPQQRGHQRGQKKLSKAQRRAMPKIKQYIPPPKPPAPPIPDPLDGQGLARTLPAELVVVLRRLGKKDDVTRRKGLDELREQYVAPLLETGGGEDKEVERDITLAAMESAIPVWLHNLGSLLQSPFHRAQAMQVQTDLMAVPSIRGVILDSIAMSYLPGTQARDILGSLLVAVLEDGRRGAAAAYKMWESVVRFGPAPAAEAAGAESESHYTSQLDIIPHLPELTEYLSLSTLDPATLHRDIHPAPVQNAFTQTKEIPNKGKGGKGGKMTPARMTPTPTPTPPPAEDDAEVEEERWARYRVGGLVGLAWLVQKLPASNVPLPEELASLLANPVLWSALGTSTHLPDLSPIGQQPPIRRAAYILLATFVEAYPAEVEKPELLKLLSATVLGNCWLEQSAVVWESAGPAVVKFLTKYPQSWVLAATTVIDDDDDGDEDDDDNEEGDDTEPPSRASSGTATPAGPPTSSKAFDDFLNFISTICPAVPHLTYVFLVVVVSTLPPTFLPLTSPPSLPLQNLFSHLWSPVDARLLSTVTFGAQPSAFQAFLQAAADTIVFLIEKAGGSAETTAWLVKEQFAARLWGDGVTQYGAKGGRRGAAPVETEAGYVARAVARMLAVSSDLATPLMAEIERITITACFADDKHSFLPRALMALTALRAGGPAIEAAVDGTIVKIVENCSEHIFQHLSEGSTAAATTQAEALASIVTTRPDLFPPARVEVLSQGLQAHIPEVVANLAPKTTAALFNAVAAVASEGEKQTLLAALWAYVHGDAGQGERFAVASGILESNSTELFTAGSLDTVAAEATRVALASDDATALAIASKAVVSTAWLSDSARNGLLSSVCDVVHDAVDSLLTQAADAALPTSALAIVASYAKDNLSGLVESEEHIHAVVAVHHLVVLFPRIEHDFAVPSSASKIWSAAASDALSADSKSKLSNAISRSLAELLGRVSCRVDPGTLVDVALASDLGQPATPATVAATLLPASAELLRFLSQHTAQPPHPTLPVIDPLVPCVTDSEAPATRPSDFDAAGRSRAARYAEAALALLRADRSLVQSLPSLLHVALAAMLLAEDGAAIPGAARGLYTPDTPASHLEQVVRLAEGALSFSLSLVDEAPLAWHKATVAQLRTGQAAADADYLQRLLSDLRADVAQKTSDIAPRAFRQVLARHLRKCGAGEAEGEVWLNEAMAMSEKLPEIALAIILAIKPLMVDSKAFATAQNRLANALTGVSVRAANDKGLPALRLLIASAPPADSASLFIPQQRAVFALRHVGGWLTSEDEAADDLADEIDVRVAELYTALAPIVQDLAGAHWDAIFDLISGAVGSCSLQDPASYPLMYASLSLLKEVRDLCASNKSLRALWVQKDEHLSLVVTLFLEARDADSVPLQMIHALILDLLTDASEGVMAAAGLAELCALLRLSSSAAIQSTAYRLLSQVIRARTTALVLEVEAAVVSEENDDAPHAEKIITFPPELVEILEAGRGFDWQAETTSLQFVMAQLLAWMAVMDHFDDASRTLRWAYLDHLNTMRLLEDALLPFLFAMLGVSEVGAWNFPASQYAVDEFYCDLLEPESMPDLVPLGSHVLYRALVTIPSAMRTFYESLKDRQLSLSLLSFVSRNYSPVIIQHEFSALREASAMAALTEEGLNVRIAQGGGASIAGAAAAEAIASYVVDEQPMEIGIRLPAEFPLKAVDVRDLRRVGVPENKWRGWLMSVQQTITSRNGLILEALTVFKKNVALHFEGVVECAICYSIISVTDRTLPTKPCRTCKNRFHASCLFKWFNSSHSSSCPLCRSLF